jgi:hypothetical protein
MRNICDLDSLDGIYTGVSSMGSGDNSIEIRVIFQREEIEYLQIETNSEIYQVTDYAKDDRFIYYMIPFSLYKDVGLMHIQVKYVDGYGRQFTFKTEKPLLNDSEIMVTYVDEIFLIKRLIDTSNSPYDIPIASHENLGVVQIGNTISVDKKGVIEVKKGELVEAITNIDIDAICK